jgi:hypothetical protein
MCSNPSQPCFGESNMNFGLILQQRSEINYLYVNFTYGLIPYWFILIVVLNVLVHQLLFYPFVQKS